MLQWRLIGAAAIVVPLIGLCWLDVNYNFGQPGLWLYLVALVIAMLGTEEVLFLLKDKDYKPAAWPCYFGNFIVMATAGLPIYGPLLGVPTLENPSICMYFSLALAGLVCVAEEMRRYQEPGKSMIRIGLSILSIFYIGGLLSFFALLRTIAIDLPEGNLWGMLALLSMIIVVKLSDSGAFFAGKLFGRTKFIPRLSPGKTAEGYLGGLLAACLGSALVFAVLQPWFIPESQSLPILNWVAFGVLVGIAGMLGDLAESLFKRDMQCKDSSTWLKGLGGILDIIDSLLFAAPITWFCWMLGLVGP